MINIAISGINAIDNPGPGTGIARSLKESDLDVRELEHKLSRRYSGDRGGH